MHVPHGATRMSGVRMRAHSRTAARGGCTFEAPLAHAAALAEEPLALVPLAARQPMGAEAASKPALEGALVRLERGGGAAPEAA